MYSAAIGAERGKESPNAARLAFLNLRVSHCVELRNALNVTDDASVADINRDFSAIIRARRAALGLADQPIDAETAGDIEALLRVANSPLE